MSETEVRKVVRAIEAELAVARASFAHARGHEERQHWDRYVDGLTFALALFATPAESKP
jgi:hypothetical protein